jgi:uncharacterized protein YbjT (DUF2867 family)
MSEPPILLTGATGYVGGRLLDELQSRGRAVRCLVRRPEALVGSLGSRIEVVRGDCLDRASLDHALQGVEIALYLVHSMDSGGDFAERDRISARTFGAAAAAAGVRRIIYLGGLGADGERLSPHLRSRQETGDVLRRSGIQVIELRASIILGSGSLSFELIRALVDRLPVMICPSWVRTKAQPIYIKDVISYLLRAIELEASESLIYEIGGADRVSYQEIMKEYARQRGLRRLFIPVPVITPYLSSLWLGLTTPLYARVGRKLIESIRNPTIVGDNDALRDFDIHPVGLRQAILRAMRNEERRFALTSWSDTLSSAEDRRSWGGVRIGTRLVDSRSMHVDADPQTLFAPIRRIGGERGWYFANWLWRLRGIVDMLAGGIGSRRGRKDPEKLRIGDAIDCWKVEAYEPGRRLRLIAEMKLPGRAWLEFEVRPQGQGSVLHQTAVFDPAGLSGLLYWYASYPIHVFMFSGMIRAIGCRIGRDPRHGSRSGDTARESQEA